jgi:DNA-binding SARP family transcriptional activator
MGLWNTSAVDAGVRLRLLGEFELTVDGEVVPIASGRSRALLGYVAVHAGTRHSRERLAYRLWPDSTDGQARTNLRNLLHQLRHAHPAVDTLVDVGRDALAWAGATAWVDVHDFDAHAGSDTLDDLRIAADLYRGDLLDDCYEDWLADDRERYRAAGLSTLGRLAAALDERGKSAEMLGVARRLVRLEPLAEEHHRLVIRACVAAGDRPAALRAFHACAAVLRDELGVAPSPATEALLSLDGSVVGSPAATGGGPAFATPIVGRDAERAGLAAAWADVVRAGHPKLVTVTGEPGVGKTRLAEEFAAWGARTGAFVARSRAYAGEGELPYAVLVDWLDATAADARAGQWPPADRTMLARIVPHLAGVESDPPPLGPDQRPLLWAAAVRRLTSVGRPLVLLADDAMWADPASLQFIHYLVRAADHPVLVIATARTDDIDNPGAEHPLAAIERALAALDRHDRIALDGLPATATRELAESLLGASLGDDRASALHADTGGNPLFVLESIRAGWGPDREPDELSPKLHAVIRGRLQHLTAPARDVLAVAAVVGRAFTAGLLTAAGRFEDTTLVAALDELWRRGVIAEHGADSYDFSHGAVRDAALAGLGPATRRLLHSRVAEALRAGDDADAVASQVATHFDQSGRWADAIEWYLRAALAARRMHADHASVAALERAQTLVPELPANARAATEWEILALLPTALVGVVGYSSPRLLAVHDRAIAVAAELGAEPGRPLVRSRVMSALCRDDFAGAETMARDLRVLAGDLGDPAWVLECEYLLGVIDFWSARVEAAARHFAAVRDGFDPATRAEHIVNFGNDPQVVCVSRLANALWFAGRPDDARRVCAEAHALAQSAGHRFTYEVVLVFRALLALDLDEPEQFAAAAAEFGTSQDRSAVHTVVGTCLAGAAAAFGGDVTGLADIERALAAGGGVNLAPGHRACMTRIHVAACLAVGDPSYGLEVVDGALGIGGTRLWEPELRRARAMFLADAGASGAEVGVELDAARQVARALDLPGHLAVLETTAKRLSNGTPRMMRT